MRKKMIEQRSTLTWTDSDGVDHEEEIVHHLDPDRDFLHTHIDHPRRGKRTTHSHEGGLTPHKHA